MKLLVIIGSTRPGRVGPLVTDWFTAKALEHGGFDEVEVADLAQIDLPMFDEPHHPMTGDYVHQHTRDWSAMVDSADAFVLVMPEYNYSFTAPLKNALDYLNREWRNKPVALVSYGGISGGVRAQQAIKPVLLALRTWPINDAVMIPMVREYLEDGVLRPTPLIDSSADVVLDELVRAAAALQQLRVPA